MSDFGGKTFVMHKKHIDLPHVIDQKLLETIGEQMASLSDDVNYTSHTPSDDI
jgi:hypothetical protein